MYSKTCCTWAVPELYLRCTWAVPGLYLSCTCAVPGLYQGCTCTVPGLYLSCTWAVPALYLGCTCAVPALYLGCTRAVPGLVYRWRALLGAFAVFQFCHTLLIGDRILLFFSCSFLISFLIVRSKSTVWLTVTRLAQFKISPRTVINTQRRYASITSIHS